MNCKVNQTKIEWTCTEVNRLRFLFEKKNSLQDMADELNRSKGAVSKALSRFQIRKKRYVLEQERETSSQQSPHLSFQEKGPMAEQEKRASAQKSSANLSVQERQWVSLAEVVQFLHQKGYFIWPITTTLMPTSFLVLFEKMRQGCEFCPKTSSDILLLANRLRAEAKQPPFCIPDVTW